MDPTKMSSDPPSFEKVWLLIQETQKLIQETDLQLRETKEQLRESDRQLREQIKETDRQIKETDRQLRETDRQLREQLAQTNEQMRQLIQQMRQTDKKMRSLETLFTGQWGKLVESLVSGDLIRLLRERGLQIHQIYERARAVLGGKEVEIDIIAANGEEVVAVEVKTTLWVRSVRNFIEKLKIFKEAFPSYQGKRVYGAIAYIRGEEAADKYAIEEGLYVIRATGRSAWIINDKDFRPRVF